MIRKGILDRWIIFHAYNNQKAWSGTRWAPCEWDGTPLSVQVCNFETEQAARDYCREIGLEPL